MSATVTPAQNAANLRTASRSVASRLGVDPTNLRYEQRIGYNKALALEILRFPQSFTTQTLATAAYVAARGYTSLDDASFSWGDFGNAAVDEGGEMVASVKSWLPSLAMVAILGALAYFILPGAFARAAAAKPAAA